jgi:hypothetical protein
MWKRIAVIGVAAALIGGAGTAAFAASSTATPSPSPSSVGAPSDSSATTSKPEAGKHPGLDRLRRSVHATWVTRNKKTTTFTTHDAIRGQVIALTPTSITVRAADNLTETYVISSRTKVFTRALRAAGAQPTVPRTSASIADVKAGDSVVVAGTGTATLSATRVVDVKK